MTLIWRVLRQQLCGRVDRAGAVLAPNPMQSWDCPLAAGSLADRSLPYVAVPLMLAGWALILISGPPLDALTLGEDTARSLGFNLGRLRLQLVAGTALSVGSAVAVTGSIGFVGLVVPHLLRPLVAHRPVLLVSGLGGAALTLAADISVRLLPVRPELKLGVVTAIIGAPFLFSLIYRLRADE